MPTTTDAHPYALSAWIAAAIGVTEDTGQDYRLTDAYGVTYTGAPAHLALVRRDLSRALGVGHPKHNAWVRCNAQTLTDWFTSPYTDPQHAAEFATVSPMRVCELVVYLFLHGHAMLDKVGPESLALYTDHLLRHPLPDAHHPMPKVIDSAPRSLTGMDDHFGSRLQITATTADGAYEVAVPMEIEASEDVYWHFTATIPVPVDQLNDVVLNGVGAYLSENRDLIEHHLVYRESHTDQGLHVEARLAEPGATIDAPDEPVEVELFFVGADRDAALQTAPFGSRGMAARYAGADDRIFSVEVEIDSSATRLAPTTAP